MHNSRIFQVRQEELLLSGFAERISDIAIIFSSLQKWIFRDFREKSQDQGDPFGRGLSKGLGANSGIIDWEIDTVMALSGITLGEDSTLYVCIRSVSNSEIEGLHVGDIIECKGIVEDKDAYFGSSIAFKPYAHKLLIKKQAIENEIF